MGATWDRLAADYNVAEGGLLPFGMIVLLLIDIDPEFGVAKSTGQAKSMAIRRMFGIGRLNPDWTLPSRLGVNPLVWKVEVNGTLVDIR